MPAGTAMPLDLLKSSIHSPFPRLRTLLEGISPERAAVLAPIDMTIGEPRHRMPDFVVREIAEAATAFGKYPPIQGMPELRSAIAEWLGRRYNLARAVDPDRHVTALCGSREGLFSAVFPAIDRRAAIGRPARDVAGLCDSTGRVFGLMPHPERFIDRTQHPQWTRRDDGPEGQGLAVFRNAVRYFA